MSILDLYESSKHRNNVAHFCAIINIAIIDGGLNEDEEKIINRFAKKLDITEQEYKEILKDSKKYPIQPQYNSDDRLERLLDLFKIIYSDHQIDNTEKKLILKYAIGLGFSEETAQSIIKKTVKIFNGDLDLDEYKLILKYI